MKYETITNNIYNIYPSPTHSVCEYTVVDVCAST